MVIKLDMYQTVALASIVLYVGMFFRRRVEALERFCIPAPVIGGLSFSLLVLLARKFGFQEFNFDTTLQGIFMMVFFTTIGFTASIKVLKKGGFQVIIFLILSIFLVTIQNITGIGLSKIFGISELIGLAASSVPMVGGHGTSGAFGPLFEQNGAVGATAVALASATFGLVMGSLIGGPVARKLILKNNLSGGKLSQETSDKDENKLFIDKGNFLAASASIALAIGFGTILGKQLTEITGLTFPAYIGSMFAAAIIRNITEYTGIFKMKEYEIGFMGDQALTFFLVMALMNLKLWQLADLAVPLIAILLAHTLIMASFAYFVIFNLMGRDYEAAVMSGGMCGFGMGATPNAMANMNALTATYGAAPRAFFILPIVGSLFIDFFNAGIITFFMNMFK
ncbi:MAG: sodium/glutamate symporter [Fusobacteriaceae bacterium]